MKIYLSKVAGHASCISCVIVSRVLYILNVFFFSFISIQYIFVIKKILTYCENCYRGVA